MTVDDAVLGRVEDRVRGGEVEVDVLEGVGVSFR